jgi:hypothetical protein
MTVSGDISSHDLARIKNSMFLGLARQPLAVPGLLQALLSVAPREPTLTVLALAGQRQRFQRPSVERHSDGIPEAARRLHEDPRPLMPEAARRILLRLANGVDKTLADAVVRAGVRRVMRAGFRLHPFDLPRFIVHIREDPRCLGLAERAYLALAEADVGGKADAPSLLHVEITTENWTEFPKGHRVAFLRAERRKDPAAARALLESVFRSESAASRADLLAALDVGLGSNDLPFLEGMATDRAESVRSIALRLTASVPGTQAYAARLAEAGCCFARDDSGVSGILKRVGLANPSHVVFKAPVAATDQRGMLTALFEGFSTTQIAAAAGLSTAEVVEALPEGVIIEALCTQALRDNDNEMVARLIAKRVAVIDAGKHSLKPMLEWLADNLPGSLSVATGTILLSSTAWQATLQRLKNATIPAAMKDDGTLVWTAAVMPAELLPSFQEMLAPLLATTTQSARDFAELALTLETT